VFTQQFTVDITTKGLIPNGPQWAFDAAAEYLRSRTEVTHVEIADVTEPVRQSGPNRKRLVELATWLGGEHAKDELGLPSEWNQGSWLGVRSGDGVAAPSDAVCSTTACAAGHIALSDGATFAVFVDDNWEDRQPVDVDSLVGQEIEGLRLDGDRAYLPDGSLVHVRDYAKEQLGLTDQQATTLFDGANDFNSMMNIIRNLLEEAEPDVVRVLKRSRNVPCEEGLSCNWCYEDAFITDVIKDPGGHYRRRPEQAPSVQVPIEF
jgi:hypothetical protein